MSSAETTNTPNQQRELVYCHECREEWYRDQHGLVCPNESCRSDFVEIIENNNDPRSDDGPPTLELLEDFDFDDEEDDGRLPRSFGGTRGTSPGGTTFFRVDFTTRGSGLRGVPQHAGDHAHAHPPTDMFLDLFTIVRNIVGDHAMPQVRREGPQSGNEGGPQEGGIPGGVPLGANQGPRPPPLFSQRFQFGPGLSPRDANSPQTGEPPAELPDYLAGLFGPPPGRGAGGDEDDNTMPGMNPRMLFQMLGFLPPPGGGDYVYSQQELDRVISQLMEQHQGNAPPPASKEAIDSLPKIRVTKEMVDDGIDCAVCKEDLVLDEEVTKLPCKHTYHLECVSTWLKEHDTCPICRHPVTPEDQRQHRQQHQHQQHQQHQLQSGAGLGPSVMTWSTTFGHPPSGHFTNSQTAPPPNPGSDPHRTSESHSHPTTGNEGGDSTNGGNRASGALNSFANLFRRNIGGGGGGGNTGDSAGGGSS